MRERGFMVRCGVVRLDNKVKVELEEILLRKTVDNLSSSQRLSLQTQPSYLQILSTHLSHVIVEN